MSFYSFNALTLLGAMVAGSFNPAMAATFTSSEFFDAAPFSEMPVREFEADLSVVGQTVVINKGLPSQLFDLEGTALDAETGEIAVDVHVRAQFTCLRLRGRRMRSGWNDFVRSSPQLELGSGLESASGSDEASPVMGEADVGIADESLLLAWGGAISGDPSGPIGITPAHATFATNWPTAGSGWTPPAYTFGDAGVGGVGGGGGLGSSFSGPRSPGGPPGGGEGEGPDPPVNMPIPEPASVAIWSLLSATSLLYFRSKRVC